MPSGLMPMPVSLTTSRIRWSEMCWQRTLTVPWSRLYLIALARRLSTTWRSRWRSAFT